MKDKIEGKLDQAKGKVKEEAGKALGDRSTEIGGKADQLKGRVKEGIGDMKRSARDVHDLTTEDVAEEAEEKERTPGAQ